MSSMNLGQEYTLTDGSSTVTFNPSGGGDGFYLTADTTGLLGQATIRAVVDNRSQTDGAIVHPAKKGPRRPTIVAEYLIITGDIADRDDAIAGLVDLLDNLLTNNGTLTNVATGDAITVRSEVPLEASAGPQQKRVIFGLVAEYDWDAVS